MATVESIALNYGIRVATEEVTQLIHGEPEGKNLLSMRQLTADDILMYIDEAAAAEAVVKSQGGIALLPFMVLKPVMRQPSTRTGGSFTTAMYKLGGSADLISGMNASAEAKGESGKDSSVAFAAQADIIGMRTAEDYGPAFAAHAIAESIHAGKLDKEAVPVINLGDGGNEHPTQALGDLFTIQKHFKELGGLTIAIVGDHERYRAFHSLVLGAKAVGMNIIAVESKAAPMLPSLVKALRGSLERTDDLDNAMSDADVLYIGRNPDEYTGRGRSEKRRSRQLAADFAKWTVDNKRLQQMHPDSILLHPRPRRNELHPDVDTDPRAADVGQMANMIPMRMAIIAGAFGKSIKQAVEQQQS